MTGVPETTIGLGKLAPGPGNLGLREQVVVLVGGAPVTEAVTSILVAVDEAVGEGIAVQV